MKRSSLSNLRWSMLLYYIVCLSSISLSLASAGEPSSTGVRGGSTRSISTTTNEAATSKQNQQRRRRAMDNHQQQHQQRQHDHHSQNYSSKQYYYVQQQQLQQEQQKKKEARREATLGDVWLCYAFALGWSAWFLSSFLNTDLMRFAESESVLVHGNVREVSIEDDSLGTGIPTYHALIDYIITVKRNADAARIQVRKSFQTQHLLQQGFANVELLVLPEEPTSSVLKEDWQREVAAQEQAEEDIISIGGFADLGVVAGGGDGGTDGGSEKEGRKPTTMTRVDVWAKRASLILSGVLVTASLIGAVQAVHRISDPRSQFLGWVSVVVGSVLLWPLAMFSLRILSTCQRLGRLPTEKSGIILKCDTNAQVGTTINTEDKIYTQHQDGDLVNEHTSTRHLDNVSHADVLDKLKTPQHKNTKNVSNINNNKIDDEDDDGAVLHESVNASADESACYFVQLPSGKKDGNGHGMVRLDDSSMSTISADSQASKSKRTPSPSSGS